MSKWQRHNPMAKRAARLVGASLLVILVGACDSFLGATSDGPVLTGERIPVILSDNSLNADAAAGTVTVQLPPPALNRDWPSPGGYPSHAMHHLEASGPLDRAWSTDVGSGGSDDRYILAPPVIANGRVYTIDADGTVRATNASSGNGIWSTDTEREDEDDAVVAGGVAVFGDTVLVATGNAEALGLDASTGAIKWRTPLPSPVHTAPTAAAGRMLLVTIDNTLMALDTASGSVAWTYSDLPEEAALLGGASPAVDAGVIVAAFTSGDMAALTLENGGLIWTDALVALRRSDPVAALADIRARPVIDRGVVFAIGHSGRTAAIDLRSGARLWERDIGGSESPWVAGDFLYMITNENQLVCLTRREGQVVWVTQLRQFVSPSSRDDRVAWTGPVLVSDRLIVAGSHGVGVSVSPYTGRPLGEISLPSGAYASPVVADGTLYFLTDDADLVAYR